jgi:amyloid beta precursor protein binding protein 1
MANNLNNELNFQEALREAHLVWSDGQISEDVRIVVELVDETSFLRAAIKSDMDVEGGGRLEIPSHVLQFQLLVIALKRFLMTNDDYRPLEGTVPDMTSDTARCVALQETYRRQAEKDRYAICETVKSLLEECERQSN